MQLLNKIRFIRLAIVFVVFLGETGNSQEYNFRILSSSEGLPQPYVYSITQDSKGYLWLGTTDGLSRYNGFQFKTFTTRDSLADNFVNTGSEDGDFMWFGHRNGGITFFNGKYFKPANLKGRKLSPVTSFAKSPEGQVWVSTLSDGLFRLDKGEILFESNILRDKQPVYAFNFINENELLLGCGDGLLIGKISENPRSVEFVPVDNVPRSKITVISRSSDSSGFYIATENEGIYKLIIKNRVLLAEKIYTDPVYELTGIQSLVEDQQGNLWLGSFGSGIIKLDQNLNGEGRITIYNKASGYVTDNVLVVTEDREGIIWSGTYGDGLTQITQREFDNVSFDRTRYGNNIFSVFSENKMLWLGTEKGLIQADQVSGKVIRFYGEGSELPKDTVTAVYVSRGKELWIGTDKNGLYRLNFENGRIVKFNLGDGILENSITSITGIDDQVWAGTKKGLYNINATSGSIKLYSINQGGLPHNSVVSLYLDRDYKLWVSTKSNIITCIDSGKVMKKPLSYGTGILTLGQVAQDSGGRIWVSSKGNGVFIFDSDSVFYLTTKQGLISDYCYSITCDNNQFIWIGHKGGFSRIRPSDFSVKAVHQIDGIQGEFQLNQNSICTDHFHRILFGSDRGLITYDPTMEISIPVPPVLEITSIRINEEAIDHGKNSIVLSPGKYNIRIDFIGTSLKEPAQVTYQYKLNGYDEWSEITKNASVTYSQIPSGEYEFILKASSSEGAVTLNPLTFTIIVKKPLWKYWWFWAIVILLQVLIIYLYVKWRIKRLLTEKEILEEKVSVRTKEIQAQKNEIEQQRDMLEHKSNEITSSITYARRIQYAVLPPAELLDKLLPDNFLYHRPRDIVSGDFYWLSEKDNKIVIAVADCTGHGVPGAFMSLLGITMLNEIVDILGILRSDLIVETLRDKVVHSLLQNRKETTTSDGMDIALCVLDPRNKKLQFTGAMNDLILINTGNIIILKADRMDVSPADFNKSNFSLNEIEYKSGDMIYMFSDGYQDQFGGDFDKKFLRPHFYNTLFEISQLPVEAQKEFLDRKLMEWMKDEQQTDDITVLGIRLW